MKVASGMIKVLGICGSLRKSSKNMEALQYMASEAPKVGIEMEIADLSEIPFFNSDTEDDKHPAVEAMLQQMMNADAFLLASPEYNYSFAPALKNALDWGSRIPGNTGFGGKAASLISVGGGLKGGRSQYHLRQVAVFLDLFVLNKPEVLLSGFDGTFDEDGKLTDEKSMQRMVDQLMALKELSLKLNPPQPVVPVIKKEL
ncbi:Probable NADPH:quinone oxidoreductase [Seminavis robusta]|uniref:Probable NADPH:quinone oxidoreductase n=1 Tax=Seminavis robusta TaxID=568900 RepID=A0A9N8DZ00_9STRA|nr:Probable NADPH:quinone oxidoreductase [Seminavis robusta]|eukprot:Sro481_g151580.1 Probable NADPH:quinone oxidoreductase (201) ;mRNA; f:34287-34889